MTAAEQAQLRSMTTVRVRRNYWLCDEQIEMAKGKSHLEDAAATLQQWQSAYLSELVRRGERI